MVDCFSKWVEIYPITNKRAEMTANWLCQELIPSFGKSCWMPLDQRNELKREFSELCKAIGITI